ncbi:MAG: hypothetical protein U9Q68_10185 [Euryarchaeota archaeon]|nr:hypothetical protein [Euryarchaeota archaeon]
MKKICTTILVLVCLSAFAFLGSAAVTDEDAIEISKDALEAKELLQENPDAAPIVYQDVFNKTPCWVVDWWTDEQKEQKLQYPDVQVWISIEDGSILFSGIPRKPVEYPVPAVSVETSSPAAANDELVISPMIVIIAIIAAVVIRRK